MKKMDHVEYPKRLRDKSPAVLLFIIKDAREAVEAMPQGVNVGYYLDEINYAAGELARRNKGAA